MDAPYTDDIHLAGARPGAGPALSRTPSPPRGEPSPLPRRTYLDPGVPDPLPPGQFSLQQLHGRLVHSLQPPGVGHRRAGP
eukprot:gene21066-40167_t